MSMIHRDDGAFIADGEPAPVRAPSRPMPPPEPVVTLTEAEQRAQIARAEGHAAAQIEAEARLASLEVAAQARADAVEHALEEIRAGFAHYVAAREARDALMARSFVAIARRQPNRYGLEIDTLSQAVARLVRMGETPVLMLPERFATDPALATLEPRLAALGCRRATATNDQDAIEIAWTDGLLTCAPDALLAEIEALFREPDPER